MPGHINVLDEEQTVTHPALSGNNIQSVKEIQPIIKYVGNKIHVRIFFYSSLRGMKQKYSDSFLDLSSK